MHDETEDLKVPGIMSQPELKAELLTYGYDELAIKRMSWPQMIDVVKEERSLAVPPPPAVFLGMPDTLDYIFDGHAGASPSGAERWMRCTQSLGMSRAFLETLSPNQLDAMAAGSSVSRQGTTAHAAAALGVDLAMGTISQEEHDAHLLELALMPEVESEAYDEEMAEYVQHYVDLVSAFHREGRTVLLESRVTAIVPLVGEMEGEVHELSGSGDTIVLPTDDISEIVIVDYKHGEGIDVDVEENPQIRIYGLGALGLLANEEGELDVDVSTIRYFIVQPRSGGVKEWVETVDELLDWRDEVLAPALTAALTGVGAEYVPEAEVCQWCVAKGACPALIEARVAAAADLFDAIVMEEIETPLLSDEDLGKFLDQAMGVGKVLEELKAEAQRRLYRGQSVPGFKLVSYTPPSYWSDKAEEKLAKHPRFWKPPTLMTPAQAQVLLKGNAKALENIEKLIVRPDKRPVIGRTDDRRKEWTERAPEQMFDVEGD